MITVVETSFCKVMMLETWNAPAGRFFISYRCLSDFHSVMGLPVIDEFSTLSSPIYFCSSSHLGKIYNAAISLAHKRDSEMGIDLGWPPVVVGNSGTAAELSDQWEKELLDAVQNAAEKGRKGEGEILKINEYEVEKLRIEESEIFVTDAPLLPKQLRRLSQISNSPFSAAISIANRLTAQKNAKPLTLQIISENGVQQILRSLKPKN